MKAQPNTSQKHRIFIRNKNNICKFGVKEFVLKVSGSFRIGSNYTSLRAENNVIPIFSDRQDGSFVIHFEVCQSTSIDLVIRARSYETIKI